ncbi:hypothetical protein [Vibrio vulnificus YJ016]|uniref:Uncharacterized protein n=1 Tax=Vibrio vulnificus (strain YJ016) TaxID=196600 RepID=Q7MHA2_VIBVY|nr:hypothetical protein [Vibrio vulnificus YJ016]
MDELSGDPITISARTLNKIRSNYDLYLGCATTCLKNQIATAITINQGNNFKTNPSMPSKIITTSAIPVAANTVIIVIPVTNKVAAKTKIKINSNIIYLLCFLVRSRICTNFSNSNNHLKNKEKALKHKS